MVGNTRAALPIVGKSYPAFKPVGVADGYIGFGIHYIGNITAKIRILSHCGIGAVCKTIVKCPVAKQLARLFFKTRGDFAHLDSTSCTGKS